MDDNYMDTPVELLYDAAIDKNGDLIFYHIVQGLKESINDWPHEVETLEDFLSQVNKFLGGTNVDVNAMAQKVERLNPLADSWYIESLGGLLAILVEYEYNNLEQVIKDTLGTLSVIVGFTIKDVPELYNVNMKLAFQYVELAQARKGYYKLAGRAIKLIKIGDVLYCPIQGSYIKVSLTKILYYRRELQELDAGCTCYLFVSAERELPKTDGELFRATFPS
jgi:hypothetical protein